MKKPLTQTRLRALLVAAVISLAVTVPAFAEEHHHDERRYAQRDDSHEGRRDGGREGQRYRGWENHEYQARDWRRHHRGYAPGVIYAPPAVVYAPPPPPPGINLIIPFDIR